MARFSTECTTSASAEVVFDYLARFSTTAEWDPGVVEAEMLTPEPVGLGSRFRVVTAQGKRRLELVYEVVEFDRPWLVSMAAEQPRLRSFDTIAVTPGAAGCTVRYGALLEARGWLRRPAELFLRPVLKRVGAKGAAGLAEAVRRLGPPS